MDAGWQHGPSKRAQHTRTPMSSEDEDGEGIGHHRRPRLSHAPNVRKTARTTPDAEEEALERERELLRQPLREEWEALRSHNDINRLEARQLRMQLFILPARERKRKREEQSREATLELQRRVMGEPLRGRGARKRNAAAVVEGLVVHDGRDGAEASVGSAERPRSKSVSTSRIVAATDSESALMEESEVE